MRVYLLAALIGLAGLGLLAGAAVLAHQPDIAPVAAERPERGGEVWGESYFPNIPLVTHRGEQVRFFDDLIEGKVVALSFIYTSCPDTCPVQTARMLQVARLLGDRLGDDVHFYSITIDPDYDTQPVLAEFAASWNIPDGWTFLTGDRDDIVLLRKKLGMRLDDVEGRDLSAHTVNLLIGNQRTGRWMKRSPFENPYVLAEQLGNWMHGWKLPSRAERSYEDAPELRQISDGEYIFRNLCSACHTIGGGDVDDVAEQRVGPDLYNVTELRDPAWLERWLREPDAMLAEKDPLAVELWERYGRIPMPNLRLTGKDVDALIGYMARESRLLTDARASRLAGHRGHGGDGSGGHAGHGEHADHAAHTEPMEHSAAGTEAETHAGHEREHSGHAGDAG